MNGIVCHQLGAAIGGVIALVDGIQVDFEHRLSLAGEITLEFVVPMGRKAALEPDDDLSGRESEGSPISRRQSKRTRATIGSHVEQRHFERANRSR